jgi:hypothetical protein
MKMVMANKVSQRPRIEKGSFGRGSFLATGIAWR